jgi:hypothetical protein
MGSVIPSRGTYRTGRGPSLRVVSFPAVAGKLDNFSATYQHLSSHTNQPLNKLIGRRSLVCPS